MVERRGKTWHEVWDRRDPAVVELNGYDRLFDDLGVYLEFVDEVAAFVSRTLRLGAEDRVADLGCGTGQLASRLAPLVTSLIGVDYSDHALEEAMSHHGMPNVEYVRADLNVLDLEGISVNKAYSASVFQYLDNYETARRVLVGLLDRGVETLVLDVPDARHAGETSRDYDQRRFSHLCFDEDQLRADFPEVTVYRGCFPSRPEDGARLTFHLHA